MREKWTEKKRGRTHRHSRKSEEEQYLLTLFNFVLPLNFAWFLSDNHQPSSNKIIHKLRQYGGLFPLLELSLMIRTEWNGSCLSKNLHKRKRFVVLSSTLSLHEEPFIQRNRRKEWACLWFSRMKYNKTKYYTHSLEVRIGSLLFGVIWALFVFYGPWVTLGLCVYSHALFGLNRTTCTCKLWHG